MSYIGFKPVQGNVIVDEFTSDGGSTYTLSSAPSNINSVEVVVGGLTQTSSAYSFVGTTLTLAGVASGTKIIVRQHGEKLLLNTPIDDSVGIINLTATGTASSSTFLRGDNSWAAAGSTSASDLTSGTLPIARIADDAITNAKMADDAIDSAQIADGSIDAAHLSANSIDSDSYVDGSIDNAHIADDAIDSEHYAAGSIDAEHLSVGLGGALSLDASPDTDHTANGPQTNTLASGYSSTIMDLVYLGSSSKWLEADADATGTSINLLGIALEAKTDTQAMNVALPGSFVRDDSWSWTPGVPLYMSGTLGAITATKPTGSGDVVRTVKYAVHADYIFFSPSSDYVTLA